MPTSTQETRFLLTAKDRTKAAFKSSKLNMQDLGKAMTGVHAKLLGLVGVGGMGALLAGIIDTNQEMQTLKSSLKTVTGSALEADKAFEKIEKFAITTPFDLNQWTEAFIKMKALGLDPSEAALNSYGNTASAMGKDLNQMIEAVADAATGEFERLKEFGIKARKSGEDVSFTFQGVTTTIKNNAKEIEGYLQGIGNNQFGAAMADQMDNITPAFSNLKQSFATLAVGLGEAGLNDLVVDITRSVTDFVNSFTDTQLHTIVNFFKSIGEAIGWVVDAFKAISFLQGNSMLQQWLGDNPSGIGNGGGSVPGYQLGDLNRSNGSADYLQTLQRLERKYDNPEGLKKQDETNDILKTIERTLDGGIVAVAG